MRQLNLYFSILLSFLLITSCENENGFIDDRERALMDECINEAFTTLEEIEKNLIGEWELVGYGNGSFSSTPNPSASIYITEDKITLEFTYGDEDNTTTHDWSVEERNSNEQTSFSIILEPYDHALAMETFCQNYMFGDLTGLDGGMYLYQKM